MLNYCLIDFDGQYTQSVVASGLEIKFAIKSELVGLDLDRGKDEGFLRQCCVI